MTYKRTVIKDTILGDGTRLELVEAGRGGHFMVVHNDDARRRYVTLYGSSNRGLAKAYFDGCLTMPPGKLVNAADRILSQQASR